MTTETSITTEKKSTTKAAKSEKTVEKKVAAPKLESRDPRKLIIMGRDEPCLPIHPAYDERMDHSDEELGIDALAESQYKSRAPIDDVKVMREGGRDIVLAGRRRTLAARKVWDRCEKEGVAPPQFFAILRGGDADALAEAALIENIRLDDPPLTLARKFQRLIDSRGWSTQKIADLYQTTSQSVRNTLNMLKLIEPAQQAVESGEIQPTVAYNLATLKEPQQQQAALDSLRQLASEGKAITTAKAKMVVARVKGDDVDPSFEGANDGSFDVDPNKVASGGKGKKDQKKQKKGSQARNAHAGPKHEAPSNSMMRRLVRAVEEKTIVADDPDLKKLQGADPWKIVRVMAGDLHVSSVPGLKQCLEFIGCKVE